MLTLRTPWKNTHLSPAFSSSPSVLLVSRECLCVWSAPRLSAIHDPWKSQNKYQLFGHICHELHQPLLTCTLLTLSDCSINLVYIPSVSPSPSVCNRRLDRNCLNSQNERSGSIPRSCGCTSSHTLQHSHDNTASAHFRISRCFSFTTSGRQSHGQTGTLLWFGRGLQWIPAAVFAGPGDATALVSHRKLKSGVYNLSTCL